MRDLMFLMRNSLISHIKLLYLQRNSKSRTYGKNPINFATDFRQHGRTR